MYSPIMSPLPLARWFIMQVVAVGDCVIDATAGNGHDTEFLAGLVGDQGRVYSFDIQQVAVEETRKKLNEQGLTPRVECIQDSHVNAGQYIRHPIKAAMFNLGYLPGGNHQITTQAEITCLAIERILEMLISGGVITIVIYTGHDAGKKEEQEILQLIQSLDPGLYASMIGTFIKETTQAPKLVVIQKGQSDNRGAPTR